MSTPDRSIALQPRDVLLLRALFDSRIMTLMHIARLFFEGRDEAAKKRVQKLKAAGFISERTRRAFDRGVLFLSRKGFQTLADGGHLSEFPKLSWKAQEKRAQVSALTLQHELEIQDVKTALTLAIGQTGKFSIARFWTWPRLYEFRVTLPGNGSTFARPETELKPDGFIQIMEKESDGQEFRRLFFLEVDRSHENLDKLVNKALAYREYYRTGGLAVKFGEPREASKDYAFRVLMVFKSEARRDNVAESLLKVNPPILKQCWLTTLSEVTTNPLGEIWKKPEDTKEKRNRLL